LLDRCHGGGRGPARLLTTAQPARHAQLQDRGHISHRGGRVEPGYSSFASISATVLVLTLTGFALGAALLRYLFSRHRQREVPVWASGVAVSGRWAQYPSLGYSNMVRVIFNVVYSCLLYPSPSPRDS